MEFIKSITCYVYINERMNCGLVIWGIQLFVKCGGRDSNTEVLRYYCPIADQLVQIPRSDKCATPEVVGLCVNWALCNQILNFTGKGMINA